MTSIHGSQTLLFLTHVLETLNCLKLEDRQTTNRYGEGGENCSLPMMTTVECVWPDPLICGGPRLKHLGTNFKI